MVLILNEINMETHHGDKTVRNQSDFVPLIPLEMSQLHQVHPCHGAQWDSAFGLQITSEESRPGRCSVSLSLVFQIFCWCGFQMTSWWCHTVVFSQVGQMLHFFNESIRSKDHVTVGLCRGQRDWFSLALGDVDGWWVWIFFGIMLDIATPHRSPLMIVSKFASVNHFEVDQWEMPRLKKKLKSRTYHLTFGCRTEWSNNYMAAHQGTA